MPIDGQADSAGTSTPSMITTEEASAVAQEQRSDSIAASKVAIEAKENVRAAETEVLLAKIEETMVKNMVSTAEKLREMVVDVVHDALGREPSRYFDASRIPLICKSIFKMELQLKLILWILGLIGSSLIVGLVGRFLKLI